MLWICKLNSLINTLRCITCLSTYHVACKKRTIKSATTNWCPNAHVKGTPPGGTLPSINHIGMCRPKGWGLCATPFRSESGYRFWSFWSEIGYGFEETTEVSMNVFIVSTSNESERNSKMRMSDVWRPMSAIWCSMSDVWCPMSHIWCPIIWCLTSEVRYQMSDVWCWWLISDVWCLMSDVGCLVSYVW